MLVVDDVPEILDLFRGFARRIHRVPVALTTEVNSRRALDLVAENRYDLVVSDFRMRQVDGIEVLRAARISNPNGRRILMTGYNEVPASLERVREASIDAYIQKPLQSQELLLLLSDFLDEGSAAIETARAQARKIESSGLA